ncbi:hypothetical protein EOL96_07095 [Candidatus Saccharibacteria bacterium]|nr:hypothetical protein [Candidatus Saccharibacteria bacterium]
MSDQLFVIYTVDPQGNMEPFNASIYGLTTAEGSPDVSIRCYIQTRNHEEATEMGHLYVDATVKASVNEAGDMFFVRIELHPDTNVVGCHELFAFRQPVTATVNTGA